MAKREYVKDLSSVTRLSDELKDIFTGWEDELDNISVAEMKIIKNAEKVVKEFAKSTKYSEESLDYASHISKLLLQMYLLSGKEIIYWNKLLRKLKNRKDYTRV